MDNGNGNNQEKGLRGTARWSWEALKQVKRKEQFKAILAEVLEKAGDSNASNPTA